MGDPPNPTANRNASRVAPMWPWWAFGLAVAGMLAVVVIGVGRARRASLAVPVPADSTVVEPVLREAIRTQVKRIQATGGATAEWATLAEMYEVEAIWPEAAAAYHAAYDTAPANPLWKLHWAICAQAAGQENVYWTCLRELVDEAPQLATVQHRWGRCLLSAGDLAAASRAFERARSLAADRPEPVAGLAEVRLQQQQYEDAIELARQAIQLDPSCGFAYQLLSQALQATGRDADAAHALLLGRGQHVRFLRDDLTEVVESRATTVAARKRVAQSAAERGQMQRAYEQLSAARRVAPRDAELLNMLAGVSLQGGRPDEARSLLDQARQSEEGYVNTYVNLTNLCLSQQQFEQALVHAREAVARGPKLLAAHEVLLMVLMQLQRTPEAREALAAAREQFPHEPTLAEFAKRLAGQPEAERVP